MNQKRTQQFRPYLTHAELVEIISLLPPTSPLCKKLKLFEYKVSSEMITPASVLSPKQTMEEKLGLVSTPPDPNETRYLSGEMTPEEEAEYVSNLMSPK